LQIYPHSADSKAAATPGLKIHRISPQPFLLLEKKGMGIKKINKDKKPPQPSSNITQRRYKALKLKEFFS